MGYSKNTFGLKNSVVYFKELVRDFGLKFILLTISTSFFLKGCLKQFGVAVELPFYSQGGWPSDVYQSNKAISNAPMTLKGICGILTDLLPFAGYEKSSWMLLYNIMGIISMFCLAIFPMSIDTTSSIIPPMLFFFIQIQTSFSELLVQGKYVEIMNKHPNSRGNIVTFTYYCMSSGEILPNLLVGFLGEKWDVRYIFWLFLPFSIQSVPFILSGCMPNDRASAERNNKLDVAKLRSRARIMGLAFLIFISCIGTVIAALFTSQTIQFIYCIIVSVLCASASFFVLPLIIAKIITYIFICQIAYVNIEGAMEYYYIADEECVPGGPNFSMVYYKTYVGLAASAAKLVALAIFQAYITHLSYRFAFMTTTVIRIVAAMFDIIIVNRWNAAIGLSDEVTFLFGNAIINEMSYMLDHMPTLVIMAKLCPDKVEGTVFAILASFGNFGQNVARFVGGFVLSVFGIKIYGEGSGEGECSTDGLTWIIVICHMILPFISIAFIYLLVPNIYMQDDIATPAYQDYKYKFRRIADTRPIKTV